MIRYERARYSDARHGSDLVALLSEYANEPAVTGAPLAEHVQRGLVTELAKLPFAFSILAYEDDRAVGLANCFEVFSTFRCQPVINVHDLMVTRTHRRRGIARGLLAEIERVARERGACKLTLEVLESNQPARAAYVGFGFADFGLGSARFLEKRLE